MLSFFTKKKEIPSPPLPPGEVFQDPFAEEICQAPILWSSRYESFVVS
jgi:hypothetical protein